MKSKLLSPSPDVRIVARLDDEDGVTTLKSLRFIIKNHHSQEGIKLTVIDYSDYEISIGYYPDDIGKTGNSDFSDFEQYKNDPTLQPLLSWISEEENALIGFPTFSYIHDTHIRATLNKDSSWRGELNESEFPQQREEYLRNEHQDLEACLESLPIDQECKRKSERVLKALFDLLIEDKHLPINEQYFSGLLKSPDAGFGRGFSQP